MSTIKTWQERTHEDKWQSPTTDYMQAEIDDLRAENSRLNKDLEISILGANKTLLDICNENTKLNLDAQTHDILLGAAQDSAKRLQVENCRLRTTLNDLYVAAPTTLECQHFHHSKSEQYHSVGECGPAKDYVKALTQA